MEACLHRSLATAAKNKRADSGNKTARYELAVYGMTCRSSRSDHA